MRILPNSDKQARINDIALMILPELIPDQLQLLGISNGDIDLRGLAQARSHVAPGITFAKLIESRARHKATIDNPLYANKLDGQTSQLTNVIDNFNVLMNNSLKLAQRLPTGNPQNEPVYQAIDHIVEAAILMGYYAGSNDMLALTQRYVNSGYSVLVTKPQNGGNAKAKATEPVKTLVKEMANFIYQEPDLVATSKATVADAIVKVLQDFSASGNNKNTPALVRFVNRAPETHTVNKWVKPVLKPKNVMKIPKASLSAITAKLKKTYTHKKISQSLKQHKNNGIRP